MKTKANRGVGNSASRLSGKEKIRREMKKLRQVVLKHPPLSSKIWNFETPDQWFYQDFLIILKVFNVVPLEEYSVPYDTSTCQFSCPEKIKDQIECMYRRWVGRYFFLEPGKSRQSYRVKMEVEGYAIY